MHRKIIIGLLVLAVTVVAMFAWIMPRNHRPGPWRLADGSELSLAGVTYGKNHAMRFGNRIVDYLYPILTPALRTKLGCKVSTLSTPDTNAIVVWLWEKGSPPASAGAIPSQLLFLL